MTARHGSKGRLWAAVAGIVLGGCLLPGCSPQPEPKTQPAPQQPGKVAEPVKVQPVAQPPAAPEAAPVVKPAVPETKPVAPEVKPAPEAKPAAPEAKPAAAPPAPADMPPSPKVSTYAPAEDLVYQFDKYLDEMQKGTATEADYKELTESEGKVNQVGNTMILLAVALGLSDEDSKYKAIAGPLVAACQKLALAKDYASTKEAVDAIVAAGTGPSTAPAPQWGKADLKLLMKQVPNVDTKLKSNLKKLKARAKDAAGNSATLAVIAQGSMASVGDTIKPAESKQWFAFCAEFRDAAADVNHDVHAKVSKLAEAKADRLQKSCDDCHKVFKEEKDKPDAK